ncbi:MAG: SPOR domain-containing protein [Faecalibacillus sp.]
MKRKAMLFTALIMMIINTVVFLYLDQILKQEINVYVVQIGRYQEDENAKKAIEQLKEAGYQGYSYHDQDIIVITKIFLKQKDAQDVAKKLSNQGMTCVVKEYFVDQKYKEEITSQKYKDIYKELQS